MNGRDADTATPLHWAVYNGHLEIAKLLVASGASLTARTKDGQTPLHWAAIAGRMLCLHYLVKCGSDLRAVDSCGYNIVHLGAQNNKPFVVFYGINSGIPIDAVGLFILPTSPIVVASVFSLFPYPSRPLPPPQITMDTQHYIGQHTKGRRCWRCTW